MNDKVPNSAQVEELVERRAIALYQSERKLIPTLVFWKNLSPDGKMAWRKRVSVVLNDPDLALIVKKELPRGLTSRIPLLKEMLDELGWKPVIPLAGELK